MKKLLLAGLLGLPMLVQAQTPAYFTLRGTLAAVPALAKVYLIRDSGRGNYIADSAAVKNGAFVLRGSVATPEKARLALVRRGQRSRLYTGAADNAVFYLEKGTTVFTSPDSLAHVQITGSPLSLDYRELDARLGPVQAQQAALNAEYQAASPETRASLAFRQRYNSRYIQLETQSKTILTEFVKSHPHSMLSLASVVELGGLIPTYASVAPLFAQLSPEVRSSPEGQRYGQRLAQLQQVAPGAPAPDFELPTADGRRVSLASYRGKWVLLDFWASWCGPCRRESPEVVQLYQQFKGRNFDILGVSIDVTSARSQWLKAIADDKLPWTQASDLRPDNAAATRYSVAAVPQNFLIDPSGKIVATNLHGDELKATLTRLLP